MTTTIDATYTDEAIAAELEQIWSSAWELPALMTVSEWADRNRVLSPRTAAEPGPWHTDRTPHARGPMDAFTIPWVREITLVFAAQLVKTEIQLNSLGYLIDQDPCPVIIVKPDEKSARKTSKKRVQPMIRLSPALKHRIRGTEGKPGKMDLEEIVLDRMDIDFAWSGSPSSLAEYPIKVVYLDEVDKFSAFAGRDAAPEKLAIARQRTFWNSKLIRTSTPTVSTGNVWIAWEESLQLNFLMPCPHCGEYQQLIFDQVKFPKDQRDPKVIVAQKLAWYECIHCQGTINDLHKPWMLTAGLWISHKYHKIVKIDVSGDSPAPAPPPIAELFEETDTIFNIERGGGVRSYRIEGVAPKQKHLGFQAACFVAPWENLNLSEVAAAFLKAKDNRADLMEFVNQWLAEPFLETVESTDTDKLRTHIGGYARGRLPDWVKALTAAVDVQERKFVVSIRGWGPGMTNGLIDNYPMLADTNTDEAYDELFDRVMNFQYEYENPEYGKLFVARAGMDSGYRTSRVYSACRRWQYVYPTKGVEGDRQVALAFTVSHIDRYPDGKKLPGGLKLYLLNTNLLKTDLHQRFKIAGGHPGYFFLHQDVDDEYLKQLAAEHQVPKRRTGTARTAGAVKLVWEIKRPGLVNDFLDCEIIHLALADIFGLRFIRDTGPGPINYQPASQKPPPQEQQSSGWTDRASGGSWGSRR